MEKSLPKMDLPVSPKSAATELASPKLLSGLGAVVRAGILIFDVDDKLLEWNSWARDMFAYLGVELTASETFPSLEDRLVQSQAIRTELCNNMPRHPFVQLENMDPDTARLWTTGEDKKIIVAQRTCQDGSIHRLFINAADTTEREARLQKAMIAAEAANRSKTQFLTSMSHELRTPLNAVIGFSDLMLAESDGPLGAAAYVEFAANINHSGHHLLELINQILDLARIEAGKFELRMEDVDITRMVDHCIRIISVNADEVDVAVVAKYSECGLVPVDGQAFKQVVLNLLSNAVKFTAAGGHVTAQLSSTDTHAILEVTDTGIGIPEKDIVKLTIPFEQASNKDEGRQQGYGLGLSISKELIELHGGTIGFESELGVGTKVTVKLPNTNR